MPDPVRLILASASPRRQSLLQEAGYSFSVVPPDVDEEALSHGKLPAVAAEALAVAKAAKVAETNADAVVLGADTVVAFGDTLLGKARDAADAYRILELLSGTTHLVITGVCVMSLASGFKKSSRVYSAVSMRRMSDREITRYIDSGQWVGKAGAYGIQDSDPFVSRLTGSHSNIVGLPMTLTKGLLSEAGIIPRQPM
jgi:septum formation protein